MDKIIGYCLRTIGCPEKVVSYSREPAAAIHDLRIVTLTPG